jgi:chromosome partitioning protein
MARVIALANQKGGVGKTTSTINIASALANRGRRVLVIDADPQASLTVSFGYNPDELETQEKTLYFSILGDKPLSALALGENPQLVPSSIQLADAEPELITNILLNAATVLKERVKEVREQYDFILIDCPPTLGLLTINGLTAADAVLIPVETNNLSVRGVELLFKTIEKLQARLNPDLQILGVLPTKYNPRYTHDNEVLHKLKERLLERGVRIFNPIHRSTAFDKATVEGKSAVELSPDILGVQVYQSVADEILVKITTP